MPRAISSGFPIRPIGCMAEMVFSSYWAQSNQLKPGQTVQIAGTQAGFRPDKERVVAKVVSQKNRGMYGSGVNDVLLELTEPADADWGKVYD